VSNRRSVLPHFLFETIITFQILFLLSCTTQNSQLKKGPLTTAYYTTLVFETSETDLSRLNQIKLNRFLLRHFPLKAEKIRLFVWSDEEYDPAGQNAQDITLAKERAWKIRDFISQRWPEAEEIALFNMAEGPHLFDRLFLSEQFEVKASVQRGGLTATVLPDGRVSYTKASKAIVTIQEETKKQTRSNYGE
jgi:hypothetical protein